MDPDSEWSLFPDEEEAELFAQAVLAADDEDQEVVPPVLEGGEASRGTRHQRKAEKRKEKAQKREAHDVAHTKEFRALLEVLQSLPDAVPALARNSATPTLLIAADKETRANAWRNQQEGEASVLAPPCEHDVELALSAVETALRTGAGQPYRRLPESFGPPDGIAVLASMIDRPPKYQEKYLAQELSLLEKIWALAESCGTNSASGRGCRNLAIVDIGAGNGCLAFLAAVLLDAHAVLIDHTLPPEPLRVEEKVPESYRSRVLRITGDVGDVDIDRDIVPLFAQHGVTQAIVVAKHLCGVGTDLALELVRRWCGAPGAGDIGIDSGHSVKLLGAVFATCCGHKIGLTDRETFATLHAQDAYLRALTGGDPECLRRFLALCTRCVAWRTTATALANRIMSSQVRAAELFEDALQQPRLNLLCSLFPSAVEVVFVDQARSPQNRCLIAGTEEALRLALGGGQDTFLLALQAARDELVAAAAGPVDLHSRGFVSTKYDYDGT